MPSLTASFRGERRWRPANGPGAIEDAELGRAIDLSAMALGVQSVGSLLTVVLHNILAHTGEISCLKGLQGLKGYPF
jgi:hypothetical protein